MKITGIGAAVRMGLLGLAFGVSGAGQVRATQPSITVDTVPTERQAPSSDTAAPTRARTPANFQQFDDAVAGEVTAAKTVTLHFAQTDALLDISSTRDFAIEAGGTCLKGDTYPANSSCTLRVKFTPQSAGYRLGKVLIEHTASATPFSLGLGGTAYAPVVSFIPSRIIHVNGTYPNGVGLLKGASSLAIDGGDSLYIADTGNNVIRQIDSSGAITTVSSGTLSAPGGVTVDLFGDVYFTEPALNMLFEIFNYGSQVQLNGTGSDTCTLSKTCSISAEAIYSPGALAADPFGNLFMTERTLGAAELVSLPYSPQFARLYDPFAFQTAATNYGFGVDVDDNIYTAWTIANPCEIVQQSLYNAGNTRGVYQKIAGGRVCGFSGDGGLAGNAEIGSQIGQIVFDAAGNMYFTDTKNNRVRRVDALTNIIRTIAGSGAVGSPVDGGSATSATLTAPTGLGVDSLGQVYIIANTLATGTAQSIRQVTNGGLALFGSQLKGTTSSARTVLLSNTGNSALVFTKAVFTGTNASDFSLDDSTTSCLLTPGSTLDVGASCVVGILFKPSNSGARSANLTFLDNTVTNSNTISLSGSGTLPAATVAIVTPAAGATVTSGAAVPFKVSVTSAIGAAPTGKVTFSVDGAVFGAAVTLASGTATVNLTGLTIKAHSLSATYGGDVNYASATVSETVTVKAAAVKAPAPPIRAPGPVPAATAEQI